MNAIEIARKMETDAIRFYLEASEKTSHPVGKKMFLGIVEDEKNHLHMLTQILQGLDITMRDVLPMENIKTIFLTMKDKMIERIKATSNDLEAFKIAMEMEKEGIAFYTKAAGEAKTVKEKDLFARLAKEEQQHHDIFANTYSFMNNTGDWFMWEEQSIVDGGTPWA